MNPTNKTHPFRILGAYAHPDDETFCAGGTLAKYVVAGAEIMVYSATRGEAGQIRDPQAATRRTLGQVRAREMQRACQQLGAQQVTSQDYGDSKLKDVDRHALVEELVNMFPTDILKDLMGHEYFVRIHPRPEIETEL